MSRFSSCLAPIKTSGDGPTLYLVHPAGGHLIGYRALCRHLRRPVYGFQSPSLLEGEPMLGSIEQVADRYVSVLRSHQPQGPYTLGAWSSGALVAYEMANLLQLAGEKVTQLFILDSPAPLDTTLITESQTLAWFFEDRDPSMTYSKLDPISLTHSDTANLAQAINLLPTHYGERLNPEALTRHYQVFRAMIKAGRNYEAPQLDVNIALCRAREEIVEEFCSHPCRDSPYWGWEHLTPRTISLKTINGNHYSFLQDPHVRAIALFINRSTQVSSQSRWSLA